MKQVIDDEAFSRLTQLIWSLTGVTLEEQKRGLLSNRLRRHMRKVGVAEMSDYIRLIKSSPKSSEVVSTFVDVVTTHKTSFFRTPPIWKQLSREVTERLATAKRVDLWSAACSNGQEPYSLAMMMRTLRPGGRWGVHATDVSAPAVERSKAGCYESTDVEAAARQWPASHVEACFDEEGSTSVIRKELKERVRFEPHNLLEPISRRFDVVLLRNVIIYFSEEDTLRVLHNALDALQPNGLLVIGESESLMSRDLPVTFESPCMYRKN